MNRRIGRHRKTQEEVTSAERKNLRCKVEDVKPEPMRAEHRLSRQTILFNNPDGRVNRVSLSQAPWVMA